MTFVMDGEGTDVRARTEGGARVGVTAARPPDVRARTEGGGTAMRRESKPGGQERGDGRRGRLRSGRATRGRGRCAALALALGAFAAGGAASAQEPEAAVLPVVGQATSALALGALAAGGTASAQEPDAAVLPVVGQATSGGADGAMPAPAPEAAVRPLVVERIRSGFVVAPDVKITGVDGGSGALAGLYGGFITDRRLLLGAGAYWLTGGPGSVDMAYGGGLVEWFANPGGRVDVSVRSLIGAGRARLTSDFGVSSLDSFVFGSARSTPDSAAETVSLGAFPHAPRLPGRWEHGPGKGWAGLGGHPPWEDFPWPDVFTFRYHENFFVAEPQLSVHLNVNDWLRIGGGAGYRFVARAGFAAERLRGFTAGVGLQLGPP